MRLKWLPVLLLVLVLSGCGEPEPVTDTEPYVPLHEVGDAATWQEYVIMSITPTTAFELSESALLIYPYNDAEKHITMEMFLVSDNNFWDTVSKQYIATENYKTFDNGYLFTGEDSITHVIVPTPEEGYVIHLYGDVPSGYFERILVQL